MFGSRGPSPRPRISPAGSAHRRSPIRLDPMQCSTCRVAKVRVRVEDLKGKLDWLASLVRAARTCVRGPIPRPFLLPRGCVRLRPRGCGKFALQLHDITITAQRRHGQIIRAVPRPVNAGLPGRAGEHRRRYDLLARGGRASTSASSHAGPLVVLAGVRARAPSKCGCVPLNDDSAHSSQVFDWVLPAAAWPTFTGV